MKRILLVLFVLLLVGMLSSCTSVKNPPHKAVLHLPNTTSPANSGAFCMYCCGTRRCGECMGCGKTLNAFTGGSQTCPLCGGSGKCPFC